MSDNFKEIDEELLYTGLDYTRQGIRNIVESGNAGSYTAFTNKQYNKKGFTFLKEPFKEVLEEFQNIESISKLPEIFDFSIKYSPIAQFKKWVFTLSNKNFIKVSEWEKKFQREFYFLKMEDKFFFQPILKNIAHEKFLLSLYQREKIPHTIVNFSTHFDETKKLILYKDYLKRKVSTVQISQDLNLNRLYNIKVHYMKTLKGIKFRAIINNGEKINHSIKFLIKDNEEENEKSGKKKTTKPRKSNTEYYREVIKLLKEFESVKKSTNKFANISIGNFNRIPVLVNLPSKYKNTDIIISFNAQKELIVTDSQGEVLKEFIVSSTPRSNWLEKK